MIVIDDGTEEWMDACDGCYKTFPDDKLVHVASWLLCEKCYVEFYGGDLKENK